jgi:hypothetical protein
MINPYPTLLADTVPLPVKPKLAPLPTSIAAAVFVPLVSPENAVAPVDVEAVTQGFGLLAVVYS